MEAVPSVLPKLAGPIPTSPWGTVPLRAEAKKGPCRPRSGEKRDLSGNAPSYGLFLKSNRTLLFGRNVSGFTVPPSMLARADR